MNWSSWFLIGVDGLHNGLGLELAEVAFQSFAKVGDLSLSDHSFGSGTNLWAKRKHGSLMPILIFVALIN